MTINIVNHYCNVFRDTVDGERDHGKRERNPAHP